MPGPTALLLTADELLLDDILRLAAAAGVTLDVTHDAGAAICSWSASAVVLVGTDLLGPLARHQPLRRRDVYAVGRGPADDSVLRDALAVGAQQVGELPACETWLVELLTDVADGGSGQSLSIAVIGGSGGAGATTFASALAVTAASRGRPTLLIDADPLGGGVDRVVGFDEVPGARWDALSASAGRFSATSLRQALPTRGDLAVLGWIPDDARPLDPFVAREVLSAAQRGSDVVVCDLPRHLDGAARELLARCDHCVVLVGTTVPSAVAAVRVCAAVTDIARDVGMVARGPLTGVQPDALSELLGVPLVVAMPDQRRLTEWIDLGLGPVRSRRGPLARAARAALDHYASAQRAAA